MSWTKLEGPAVHAATPKLIRRFTNMTPCKDDRPLSENRLTRHSQALLTGELRAPEWASAVCDADGVEYRVNGKHTSQALLAVIGTDFDLSAIKIIVTKFSCATLEDVAHLYSTFDAAYSVRTSSDIYVAYAGAVPQLANIPKELINKSVAGIAYGLWEAGGGTGKKTSVEKAELLLQYPSFVTLVADLLGATGKQHRTSGIRFMKRAGVIAAMFLTWLKDSSKAEQFWVSVRDGSDPDFKAPSRVLQKWLLTTTSANRTTSDQRYADAREIKVKCLNSWNAWRRGETLTTLRYSPTAETPKVA